MGALLTITTLLLLLLAFSWFASLGGFWGLQELVGWLKKFVSTATINLRFLETKAFLFACGEGERESLLCVFPSFRLCSKWTRRIMKWSLWICSQ